MEVLRYVTAEGLDVVGQWLSQQRDARTRAKIAARFARLSAGNFGDHKIVREGIWELRIHWGPGYRVYYALWHGECVLLLCGGDKQNQPRDIARAIEYWNDFRKRTDQP
jgi:putative addiction module killer protein